jgi:hypothetical protein
VRGLEERAEVGIRRDPLSLDELDRAIEQRFFGGVTANRSERGELLQRA